MRHHSGSALILPACLKPGKSKGNFEPFVLIFIIVAILIAFNGLYVAAEFAAVSVRKARLAQIERQGDPMAGYIMETVESPARLDTYVAACQIGITVSSLLLGFYGNARLTAMAAPYFAALDPALQFAVNSAITIAVLVFLTITQVILGELAPKNVALQYPERVALLTARPMMWSVAAFKPLIAIANGSGAFLMRLAGLSPVADHAHIHSPEEIRILVEESSAGGVLDAEERRLLVNTLELRHLSARKVMIPRNHMLAAPVDTPLRELFRYLAQSNYSRVPVYRDTIDTILGVVHLKDLIEALYRPRASAPGAPTIESLLHPLLFIPDSVDVGDVMRLMQRERKNMVIVVDEYGGTAGMITFEDLLEEIIGEFQDEYDVESPALELRPNGRLRIRGDLLIDELNDALGSNFQAEGVDTVGGLIFSELGDIPQTGETVEVAGFPLRVDRLRDNAVAYVSIPLSPEQAGRVRRFLDRT